MPPAIYILFAVVLFGMSVRVGSAASFAAVVGTFVLMVAVHTTRAQADAAPESRNIETRLLIGVIVFGLLGAIGWAPSSIGPTTTALEVLPSLGWICIAIASYLPRRAPSRAKLIALATVAIVFTAVVGVVHIRAAEGVGLDVLVLHKAAAEAIANGQNPYTDAVTVPNGAPTAQPGDVIEGYVYPPITAIAYAAGEWLADEPRYTSLVSWLGFLVVVAFVGVSRRGRSGLLALLLVASIPGWPLVLRAAWTEPFSLVLGGLAFLWWLRPWISGTFLGMTLGSKQYFAVTAPVLALFRDRTWLTRALVAVGSLIVVVGVGVALGPSAFWDSAVAFHTSTPTRPDSVNLVGLLASFGVEWVPPSYLAIVVGLAASIWASLRAQTRKQFFLAAGFTLAASFMVSSQAFANYWFLVFGLTALALLDVIPDDRPVETSAGLRDLS